MAYQIVEGQTAPKYLGTVGPWGGPNAVVIPANARWYVQPYVFGGIAGIGGIGGGVGGIGGVAGIAGVGGFNGFAGVPGFGGMPGRPGLGVAGIGGQQLGQFGNLGGQIGNPGAKRPPAGKAPVVFSGKLTGKELQALVAEMKKQSIPGLAVERMEFTDADLAGLRDMTGLQTLLLHGTGVGDDGLEKLARLKGLRTLALEGTAVTDEGLKRLKDVKYLTELRLGGNKITDAGMTHLRELAALRSLRLTWTGVRAEGLTMIRRSLDKLESLELAGDFTDKDLEALKDWTSLKTLRLHQTKITDEGLKHLTTLPNLRVLSLDGYHGWETRGAPTGLGVFPGGVPLGKNAGRIPKGARTPDGRTVAVGGQDITAKGLEHLKALHKLVSLELVSEKITDEGTTALKELKELKSLSLYGADLSDKGLAPLRELKKLETLDLRQTATTGAGAAQLKGMPRLKTLYTSLYPFDPTYKTQLDQYRRALPGVKILSPWGTELKPGFGLGSPLGDG